VDSVVARNALSLLGRLFRYGEISYHGGFMDVATARSTPLSVEPVVWGRLRRDRDGSGTKGDCCLKRSR